MNQPIPELSSPQRARREASKRGKENVLQKEREKTMDHIEHRAPAIEDDLDFPLKANLKSEGPRLHNFWRKGRCAQDADQSRITKS